LFVEAAKVAPARSGHPFHAVHGIDEFPAMILTIIDVCPIRWPTPSARSLNLSR
jgi:hypothetical protein